MSVASRKGSCGTCTLCCRVVGVAELGKPADVSCLHCGTGRGCGIYDSRPPGCRDFSCTWLVARRDGQLAPKELRPDRCHVVFQNPGGRGDSLNAHVDPEHPRAWAEGAAMAHIAAMASLGVTVAVHSAGRYYVVDQTGVHQGHVGATLPDGGLALSKGRRMGSIL